MIDATPHKTVEIGARRGTGGGRVPELVFAVDILGTIHYTAVTVDDD